MSVLPPRAYARGSRCSLPIRAAGVSRRWSDSRVFALLSSADSVPTVRNQPFSRYVSSPLTVAARELLEIG